ncbi:DUF2730 domain-containing protein [Acidovorax sp. GBBC 3332]|jgi:hypothetical protein|nr:MULTISPECIES: DUF2730 domain-containing protein [unclassified Acidovorax]MDA8449824.1 DUF2730 domain-containing protein [Acidovorax sp. GBBC 3297]MDA8459269.1 DUF2730 domain-containing protein [Acidovorax sp. GBBC 3333]MDA8464306.1 DUF2730 domain-containing protein [Acidovorax sp. GBBC 3332]MDA8469484.1 DUF2730 domain-containing protein [Acidovorax sp. GBBC 3299]
MSFTEMTFDFEGAKWLVATALAVYTWFIGRQSASAAELLELRTRITTLEVQMAQVPSQAQLTELLIRVERVGGSVDVVAAAIEPLTKTVDRIDAYLMNQK